MTDKKLAALLRITELEFRLEYILERLELFKDGEERERHYIAIMRLKGQMSSWAIRSIDWE